MKSDLTTDVVRRVADLARLELSEAEIEKTRVELGKILSAFEHLERVTAGRDAGRSDIVVESREGAAPLTEETSRLRPDDPARLLDAASFLATAPDREGALLRVPAILEQNQ